MKTQGGNGEREVVIAAVCGHPGNSWGLLVAVGAQGNVTA